MRNILKINTLLIIMLLLSILATSKPAYAGPWTLSRRGKFAEIYHKFYHASHDYDKDKQVSRKANDGRYDEYYLEIKGEWGITDNLNYLASLTYKDVRYRNDPITGERTFQRGTSLGDLWLQIKYRFMDETKNDPNFFTTAMQLSGKFPMFYDRNNPQPPGTGYIDGGLTYLIGKNLPGINSYAAAETGFFLKGGPKSNYIPYSVEYGWQATEHFMLKGVVEGIESLSHWAGLEEDYTVWDVFLIYTKKGEVSTVYRDTTRNLNIQVGYGETFRGRNTGKGEELIFSTSYRF